jgi:hypothetical protein
VTSAARDVHFGAACVTSVIHNLPQPSTTRLVEHQVAATDHHHRRMRDLLMEAVRRNRGAISREHALTLVPRHIFDKAVKSALLTRFLPGVFVATDRLTDDDALDQAVMAHAPDGAFSHISALRALRIRHVTADRRRHITVNERVHLRSLPHLVVHRRKGFVCEPPMARRGEWINVVAVERALIESWPMLPPGERRSPSIEAVRRGMTSGASLLGELHSMHTPEGSDEMRSLFALIEAGCRSELELFGHRDVFDSPDLPRAVLQCEVRTEAGRYFLDRAYLDELVGVELDGAAWHGSKEQRERDVRRDAALAAAGWLIVRFTHDRLRREPEVCREELRQILESRRRQLHLPRPM